MAAQPMASRVVLSSIKLASLVSSCSAGEGPWLESKNSVQPCIYLWRCPLTEANEVDLCKKIGAEIMSDIN
jgi:hypothetical protein